MLIENTLYENFKALAILPESDEIKIAANAALKVTCIITEGCRMLALGSLLVLGTSAFLFPEKTLLATIRIASKIFVAIAAYVIAKETHTICYNTLDLLSECDGFPKPLSPKTPHELIAQILKGTHFLGCKRHSDKEIFSMKLSS